MNVKNKIKFKEEVFDKSGKEIISVREIYTNEEELICLKKNKHKLDSKDTNSPFEQIAELRRKKLCD